MTVRWTVRTLLALAAATMAFAGAAQAATSLKGTLSGGSGALGGASDTLSGASDPAGTDEIPSQAEIDGAIESLGNGTGQIVELKRERPAWFTEELEAQVRENGVSQAPADAPLPGQVGIRPGSHMVSPFWCTMNYIFQKGGTLAIGTAGHCLEGNEPVVLLTLAPTGGDPVLVELGKVLLRRDGGIGRDYGLVEVPPERHQWVFPTMAAAGGPCGTYSAGDPQPVAHYGHGLVGGSPGTPRPGMGFELEDPPIRVQGIGKEAWTWDGDSIIWAGYVYGGDSGSPVRIAQLPAVSNLTHGIGITGLEPSPIGWGTKVSSVTRSGWTLVNSLLCPPGSPSGGDTGDSGGPGKGGGKGNGKGPK